MGKESGNEMEQIQRSLEQFLDREVARYEKQESRNTERRYTAGEEYPEEEYSDEEYPEDEYSEEIGRASCRERVY